MTNVDTHPEPSYSQLMEVQLSPEQAAQLASIAAQAGRPVDELAREVLDRYLAEEAEFRATVQEGVEAADRGDFVPSSEVWAKVERALKG